MTGPELESRRALHELIALLQEIDERYLGDEWGSPALGDTVDGFHSVAHLIQGGFLLSFESDPEHPFFRPIVTRYRKLLGDNPDALYYTAPVRADRTYRVRGNLAGAVYLSFTVERGSEEGGYSDSTAGVLRDRDFDVAADADALVVEVVTDDEPAPECSEVALTRFSTGADFAFADRGTPVHIGAPAPR